MKKLFLCFLSFGSSSVFANPGSFVPSKNILDAVKKIFPERPLYSIQGGLTCGQVRRVDTESFDEPRYYDVSICQINIEDKTQMLDYSDDVVEALKVLKPRVLGADWTVTTYFKIISPISDNLSPAVYTVLIE